MILGICLTGLIALATGCGGPSEEQKQAASEAREKAEKARAEADAATKLATTCRSQIGGFIRALSDVNSRLNVGMNFATYSTKVGDIQVAYDRLPLDQMNIECTTGPGLPAEDAGQAYQRAHSQWEDCFENILSCDMDSIDPGLQAKWSNASTKLDEARAALADLKSEAKEAEADAEEAEELADEAEAELE